MAALISIAEEFADSIRTFVDDSMGTLRSGGHALSFRDRMLIAMELKIDSAFRALIDDARQRRIEAVHHLKTMVEAFIYLHVVGKDKTDHTARRLLARVCRDKARFFRLNRDYDEDGQHFATWNDALEGLAAAGITPLGDVAAEAAAHGPEIAKWYEHAYRAACEPAHMADLLEFAPQLPDFNVKAGELHTGIWHAIVAVDQALQLMVNAVRFANDNQFDLSMDVEDIERRVNELRMVHTS